jgi:gamma-glutamyl hercynylcysteine S-oxide synthase
MDRGEVIPAQGPRSATTLAAALVDAREYTKSLYAHLTPAQRRFPMGPTVNPADWELGHIGWFQEFWCRRQQPDDPAGARTPSRHAGADALWNSSTVPHATRWSLPLPDWHGINAYLDATLADTLAALANSRDGERYFFELALYHEDMHGEALLMTLQTLALPAPPALDPAVADGLHGTPAAVADQSFAGGVFTLGTAPGASASRFVFDNEKWAHPVTVAPFAMAAACVTNAEFAAFIDAGGYRTRRFWTDAGWGWLQHAGAAHPVYWNRSPSGWTQRRFERWLPLEPALPVMHVNAHEAEAYCRFAGRRLPTEAEWEFAATRGAAGVDPVLDHVRPGPAASRCGMRMAHLLGNVWEWTASAFTPYPGFAADPYVDYSAPWFGDHRVLRGGSFATRSRLVHPRFRNFYQPERADPFVGFRTCALQHEVTKT